MTRDGPNPRCLAAAMIAVGLVAVLAAAPGAWARATHGNQTSADEPHYLLTALSLAEDGDLDVSDEVADERYRAFHEQRLKLQAGERDDGALVVPHDPLLPALLAPAMGVAGWRAAKLTLAVSLGLLAALTLWTAVRRLDLDLTRATATVAVFNATAPLTAYGTQVYPEVPAALATTAAAAALLGPMGRRGSGVVVAAVIALPWLSVKYVPVAVVLALTAGIVLWRRDDRRAALAGAAALGVAGIAYVAAHLAWYEGLTVYASGAFFQEHGGEFVVVGTDPNYLGRARRLIGLFIDRDFGLGAWQPAWLLAVPATAALARARPPGWGVLVAPAAMGWSVATFVALTMQGWWFPGRQVVVVLPLVALAISWWVDRSRLGWRLLLGLGALGAVTWGWFLVSAVLGDVTVIVDFAAIGDPLFRARRLLLPDYLDVTPATWIRQAGWIVAAAFAGLAGWRSVRSGRAGT